MGTVESREKEENEEVVSKDKGRSDETPFLWEMAEGRDAIVFENEVSITDLSLTHPKNDHTSTVLKRDSRPITSRTTKDQSLPLNDIEPINQTEYLPSDSFLNDSLSVELLNALQDSHNSSLEPSFRISEPIPSSPSHFKKTQKQHFELNDSELPSYHFSRLDDPT